MTASSRSICRSRGQRSFHGVIWRVQDADGYESFFVRPHQVGNPDAIQYTPVSNGISSWQLYHGDGFWAPIAFPIGPWFTIRVAFAGARADVYVGDLAAPALQIAELKRPLAAGSDRSPGRRTRLARRPLRLRPGAAGPAAGRAARRATHPGVIGAWNVSDPFVETDLDGVIELPPELIASRSWTRLAAEPSGLLDLSRAHGIHDGRNTVLVRATIDAPRALVVALQVGFSDRAVVFLNGRALFRGDDGYRSRDYRFLAASASGTRSTCRSGRARTTSSWPSRRTSADGASRPGSPTVPSPPFADDVGQYAGPTREEAADGRSTRRGRVLLSHEVGAP